MISVVKENILNTSGTTVLINMNAAPMKNDKMKAHELVAAWAFIIYIFTMGNLIGGALQQLTCVR